MVTQEPTVSVVIPTCDRPDLLQRAIDSVVDQDFASFEIIVVDDGVNVPVNAATLSDERIVVVKAGPGHGPGAARNRGIEAARGQYVSFLDDDDHWLPGKITASLDAFDRHPTAGLIFHNTGRPDTPANTDDHEHFYPDPTMTFATRPTPHVDSVMIRRTVLDDLQFSEDFPAGAEIDLFLRIAKVCPFVELERTYAIFDPSPVAPSGISLLARIEARKRIGEDHSDIFSSNEAQSFHSVRLGHLYRRSGQYDAAFRLFIKAIRLDPGSSAAWKGLGTSIGNRLGLR